MPEFRGFVRWFNSAKGYGFLGREHGPDVFVHFTSIQSEGFRALKEGEEVRLTGFGVFVVATRAGGKGRNPQTGEEITIKPSKQPRFRAGKQLKDSLN